MSHTSKPSEPAPGRDSEAAATDSPRPALATLDLLAPQRSAGNRAVGQLLAAASRLAPGLDVLALQRSVGNHAVARLIGAGRAAQPERMILDPQRASGNAAVERLLAARAQRAPTKAPATQPLLRPVVGQKKGSPGPLAIQRTIGDGDDLTSPRFALIEDLEAAYDDEREIKENDTGRGVQAIQQALYDIGFSLPVHGADGRFGPETKAAVEAFQRANAPLVDDGKVDRQTMIKLNTRFAAFALPTAAARAASWTPACVRSIICPWSPHTIEVLRTRITLKSFDSISWADERWNGATWVPAPFPGGGYNTGTEIGVLNSSCEHMAETLYHEVLHAEQPTSQRTTLAKESYAYRIGEEFSIAAGLGGRPALRSTGPHGRQFAAPATVRTFVAAEYPSVPAGGGNDEIIGKAAAAGHVQVQRPNGTIYTRPAAAGERVPGPMTTVNEKTHPSAAWTCP